MSAKLIGSRCDAAVPYAIIVLAAAFVIVESADTDYFRAKLCGYKKR